MFHDNIVNLSTSFYGLPDEDECFAAEGRHLLNGLVQHQLRLVKVQVAPHVVVVPPLLATTLKVGKCMMHFTFTHKKDLQQ